MATLTKVAITTRKIIRYSIYALVLIIIARITFGIGSGIYRRLFPKPPPAPTVAFGRLPNLPFDQKEELPGLQYRIETADGVLPVLPGQVKVYFMPKPTASLLALDVAKQSAGALGYTSEPQQVSESVYRFSHPRAPSTLEINIVSGALSVSYNLSVDSSPLSSRPPTPEVAASQAKSYLSSAGILPEDLTGPTSSEFLKVESQQLTSAISLSEADVVRVNLFRKAFDEIPSVTQNPASANIWFIISGITKREKQVVAAQYHYFPIDEDQAATYPIKTAQSAFDELSSGGGFVASLGQNQSGNVTIRRIYLAYYDPGIQVDFYQPVIVFEGDGDFTAYVPAISAEYYGE